MLVISAMAGAAEPATSADDEIEALMRQAAEDDARNAAARQPAPAPAPAPEGPLSALQGFAQVEVARAYDSPSHWSKMLGRLEFGSHGKTGTGLGTGFKWKLSARVDYDPVFSVTNYYGADARHDQQFNVVLRENYIDTSLGSWDLRLGRQHVIWGEMVGLFFADVVSARDLRQFILPEFNILRIPQWAARAEYFGSDFHGELLWIPVATYDEIGKPFGSDGKPGTEFYPYQVLPLGYLNEVKPATKLGNSNYGARGSWLIKGWDLSAFYYRSMDASATFYQIPDASSPIGISYQARHDRISQIGGTLAKDLGNMVLKAETVYTHGRRLPLTVLRPSADGVVQQNTLDWVVGLNFSSLSETRFNVQLFQSITSNNDPDVIPEKRESGYSLLLNGKLAPKLEGEILWVSSLNRGDWMVRPKLNWNFEKNWRLVVGVDAFHGPVTGFFGRYSAQDRVYSELKYSF